MDKLQLKKLKEHFIIEKQEFNYFTQKMQNKKYRFYTRDFLPPTYKDTQNLQRDKIVLDKGI